MANKPHKRVAQDIVAKKSLGQHFLHDEQICARIVEATMLQQPQRLLEIGPGPGAITKYFVQYDNLDFKCVELDDEKVVYLQKNYPRLVNQIIHNDVLRIEPPWLQPFVVVGNFPYNISTEIVFKLLEWRQQVPAVIGMFQKEVAERFASKHGNKTYGVTSVLAQCFYDIEILFDVPPQCFTPPPKVNSAVLMMKYQGNKYNIIDFKHFSTFVKTAFSQRRKTLRNALKSSVTAALLADDIFMLRPEQLSPSDYATLYHRIFAQ